MDPSPRPTLSPYWEHWYQSHQESESPGYAAYRGSAPGGTGLVTDRQPHADSTLDSGIQETSYHPAAATTAGDWTISYSQLKVFDCPAHWRRQYLEGIRDIQKEHGLIGNGAHGGVAKAFAVKRDLGIVAPTADVMEFARLSFIEDLKKAGGIFTPSRKDMTLKKALGLSIGAAGAFWEAMKDLDPLLIEPTWYFPIRPGYRLIIRPDLITKSLKVYDWKTQGAHIKDTAPYAWTMENVDKDFQAAIYGLGMRQEFLVDVVYHTFVVVKKTMIPKPPRLFPTLINSERAEAAWNKIYETTVEIENAVISGDFPRSNNPDSHCTWCPLKGRGGCPT